MRYLKLFLLFFLVTYYNSSANTYNQDSALFVNKSTKSIAKMIYAYMQDFQATMQNYGESEISDAEKKSMQLYKSKFLDNLESYKQPSALLDSIDNFLSKSENNWNSSGYKIFKILRGKYEEELQTNRYNLAGIFYISDNTLIYLKKQNKRVNDNVYWNKMLTEISKDNIVIKDSINQSVSQIENIPITEMPSNYINTINRENKDKGSIYLKLIVYFVIFCLGCLSAMVYSNFRIKDILKEEYDEYKRLINSSNQKYPLFVFGVIKFLKERKNNYRDRTNTSFPNTESNENYRLRNLTEDNKNLAERYSKLEKEYLDFKDQVNNNNVISENVIVEQTGNLNQQGKKENILYFSIPEEDGSFLEEKASVTASVRSYYKIEYIEGNRTGKLIFRSGNLDTSALSQMDYILGPVCEIENSLMRNPTRIIIGSQGSVLKEEDKWKVKDKIKIKLI